MPESRVKSLHVDELDEQARAAWDEYASGTVTKGVINPTTSLTAIAGVLLHNPGVYRALMVSAESLLRHGDIPLRERQIIQLRVAWLCRAIVMWSNHTGHAHEAGITKAEVDRITQGPGAPGWADRERALLRMADGLHRTAAVTDEVWSELAAHFSVAQLVTLPMLVGYYHQLCYVFNSLGVPEPDATRGGLTAR